jgi:cytochrome P450
MNSLFRLFHGSRMKQFDGMPGPTPSFPLGTLPGFFHGRQPWDVCANYERTYGGVTLIWEGSQPVVVVNDGELIRDVLITKRDDYWKDAPSSAFRPVLKVTEFNENGEEWRRLREGEPMCVAGFDQWLPTQAPVVRKVVSDHLLRLTAAPTAADLLPIMERMVYDVYNACCIGKQLSDSDCEAFYTTSNMATKRMKLENVLPKWLFFNPVSPRFWGAMRQHFGAYDQAVQEAKATLNSSANDLLHVCLRKGHSISDEQMAMYLGNIHAGGVFSAGTALVNTLYLVNRHANVANALAAQLRDLVKRKPEFDVADLDQCPLLEYALRESMRYYAPVPMFFRNVLKTRSTQLGKYTLPPNTVVYLVVQGVHRSHRYWDNPDHFDPERWAKAPEAKAYESDRYLPFGRGPRLCVGASLTMFCMKMMLAGIWSKARVDIDPSIPYRQFFHCGVAEPRDILGKFVLLS